MAIWACYVTLLGGFFLISLKVLLTTPYAFPAADP